jgi:DNA polymerase
MRPVSAKGIKTALPVYQHITRKALMKLFIDFESYYSRADGYDLKHISMTDYIMDSKFKAHGVGVMENDHGQGHWISGNKIEEYLLQIDWAETDVVAHNVKFDGAILAWKYGIKPRSWIDTKAMAKALLSAQVSGFSLGTLAAYLGLPQKGELKADGVRDLSAAEEAEMASYCLRDVEICKGLYDRLAIQFPQSQWAIMDWSLKCFIEPELVVDKDIAEQVFDRISKEQEGIISSTGLDREVFSSNPQFAELLKSKGYELPHKISPRTKKLIPALALGDSEFINFRENADGELKLLCDARVASKQTLEKSRAEKLASIGRYSNYPFDIEFSGAKQTHRFSGGNGAGGNPQNFPKNSPLREAIKAPKGYTIVCADYKSIEFRVLSYLAGAKKLISGIEEGTDIYCDFASIIFGRRITKADKKEREYGKVCILALGYGMGPEKFMKTAKMKTGDNVSFDEARKTVYKYRDFYPEIKAFWGRCTEVLPVLQQGFKTPIEAGVVTGKECLILPSGLRIQYPGLSKGEKEWTYSTFKKSKEKEEVKIYGGKITENLCQALAGEICKEAIQRLIRVGIRPIGQVHDELLVVCKEDREIETMEAVYKAMTDPLPWWPRVRLDAEVKSGKSWAEAK